MADLLPLFPLPNVVLFPDVFLPLHIFEPRYRDMTADALATDRLIGIALLKPGWQADYEGRPPIYRIGCSGVITHAERLPDGRYNIVLRGVERFRILDEDHQRSYRRAAIERMPEGVLGDRDRQLVKNCRARLESILSPHEGTGGPDIRLEAKMPAAMGDEDLVNALSQYLDFEPLEKQALLEQPCLRTRAASLVELLEMKMLAARAPVSNVSH